MAVGAVLVQNTTWRNADLAVANLRKNGMLHPVPLTGCDVSTLEALIRPAGFQRQKSQALLGLSRYAVQRATSFTEFLQRPVHAVRKELLALRGIGPETADSILLYGGGHEVFVVDIYLRRFLLATGFEALSRAKYDGLRVVIEELVCDQPAEFLNVIAAMHETTPSHPPTTMSRAARSPLADIYNELHAVLVRDGVEKRRPGAHTPGREKDL